MALNKNAGKFEHNGDDDGFPQGDEQGDAQATRTLSAKERAALAAAEYEAEQAAEAEAAAAAKKSTAEPAKTTALAAAKGSAVQVGRISDLDPFQSLENNFPVKFNTFPQIQADQGNFKLRDGNKNIGDTFTMEVVSWQKQWQLAPGDIESAKAKEFLRYSPDGITAENGDSMQEILKLARENGFPKAKISERIILVGAVIDGNKQKALAGKFVQIDMSQSSVANFGRYRLEVAFKASKGLLPEGFESSKVKLHAKSRNENKLSWTEAEFGSIDHEFED